MKLHLENYARTPQIEYAMCHANGKTYDVLGEDRKAAAWYRRALAAYRESTDVPSTELAILLWKLGHHEDARDTFRRVLTHHQSAAPEDDPDDRRRQISLSDQETALSYLWLGEYEKALEIANDYIEGNRGFGSKAAIYIAISIVAIPLMNNDADALRTAIEELDAQFPKARPPDASSEMEIRRFVLRKLERQPPPP